MQNNTKNNDIVLFQRDSTDKFSRFEAVSVIEYQGNVSSSGRSEGHYICDIKERSTKQWFRTNDNINPVPIQVEDVSKRGYVILYRKLA